MADLVKFYNWVLNGNLPELQGMLPAVIGDKEIPGWCTPEQAAILNHAVSECLEAGEEYLELGSFCGRSLEYALRLNTAKATVIDPLDLKVADRTSYDFFNDTINAFSLKDRVAVIKQKYQELRKNRLPKSKFGVVLIDGDHDSGHTLKALEKLEHSFADKCIIVIDDYLIHGGDQQIPAKGFEQEIALPVARDVNKWLAKNFRKATPILTTPWLNGQLIIFYNRKKHG